MEKQRVFLTGATGGMGFASLRQMLKDSDKQDSVVLSILKYTDQAIHWVGYDYHATRTAIYHTYGIDF